MDSKPRIVLGSSSPRRKELLESHYELFIKKPNIDESLEAGEKPMDYVTRIARQKYDSIHKDESDSIVLAADTTVAMGNQILGKAQTREEAREMLRLYSGKAHFVITSVCVGADDFLKQESITTKVTFRVLEDFEIEAYLSSREWLGKAGAYAIQGRASVFVDQVQGSLTNVIGLPLKESISMIEQCRARPSV